MQRMKYVYTCIAMVLVLFLTGADFEHQDKEYAFFAETKEKAEEIAKHYSAELISFSNGIGVLLMSHENMQHFNSSPEDTGDDITVLYPEYMYTVELGDTNENEEQQWHLGVINVEPVWNITKGKGIKVAVIDTGVDMDHFDLRDAVTVADTSIPESEYGENGRFLQEYMGAQDYFGHGTHVVGIVGARDNGIGCNGIAPECDVISIKALEKEGSRGIGKTSWVVAGINKAIEHGADVINLSLGGTSVKDEMLLKVIEDATESGIVVVCAAGNITGTPKVFYPGAYEETIAVSGVKKDGEYVSFATSYSNYGSWIDISAPGSSIMSTIINGYGTKSGTSMASPIVSGAVALLKAKDNTLSVDNIKNILYTSSVDMGEEGRDDKYGYGVIDIEKMFKVYEEEYVVPSPVVKIPDNSIIGEDTVITIDIPQAAQKVVYTLDGSEPSAESPSFPVDGIVAEKDLKEITIKLRTVMPDQRMGKVTSVTYTLVKNIVEMSDEEKLDEEIIPQYGAYVNPVLKLRGRSYKFTVKAGKKLKVSGFSDTFNMGLYLFEGADETSKILSQSKTVSDTEGCKKELTWKNSSKTDKEVWLAVIEEETAAENVIMKYSLSWECKKIKNTSDSENADNKNQDNEGQNNENQNNGNQNNEKIEHNNNQSSVPDTSEAVTQTEVGTQNITQEASTEEFIYEDDWLYTMSEASQEDAQVIEGEMLSEADEETETDIKRDVEESSQGNDESLTDEVSVQNKETEEISETTDIEDTNNSEFETETEAEAQSETLNSNDTNLVKIIIIIMSIIIIVCIVIAFVKKKQGKR